MHPFICAAGLPATALLKPEKADQHLQLATDSALAEYLLNSGRTAACCFAALAGYPHSAGLVAAPRYPFSTRRCLSSAPFQACAKWRKMPPGYRADDPRFSGDWYCDMNPNREMAAYGCDAPQEVDEVIIHLRRAVHQAAYRADMD